MRKTYPNTKKSRNMIPNKSGAYNLRDRNGKVIYTGMTNDLNRRVKEHHYEKSKHFASVSITPTRSKSQAKVIEKQRLKSHKPSENK